MKVIDREKSALIKTSNTLQFCVNHAPTSVHKAQSRTVSQPTVSDHGKILKTNLPWGAYSMDKYYLLELRLFWFFFFFLRIITPYKGTLLKGHNGVTDYRKRWDLNITSMSLPGTLSGYAGI